MKNSVTAELLATPAGFIRGVLNLITYPWQDRVFHDFDKPGAIAVKAANGAGKTTLVGAPLALWCAAVYPQSLVVVTAGVFRQVKEQFFPALRTFAPLFPDWEFLETSVTTNTGSRILGFSTDEPGNFEGFHNDHLLMIADEAKTIPDAIFEAMERCQPERLLLLSSPGGPSGMFFDAFGRHRQHYRQHTVTSYDCPHISPSWIQQQIEKHGPESSLIRSMIYAEFSEMSDQGTLSIARLETCLRNPPAFQAGNRQAFCDFAAGGDENVLAIREGNRITLADAWRDNDTMRAVGRFIRHFWDLGLKPEEISADGSGLGIPICDRLAEKDWPVRRINNGASSREPANYANLGTEIWMSGARMIEKGEVILPDDRTLLAQLTSRKAFTNSRGQIVLESKEKMRSRGLPSPDRAEAVLGCLFQRKPARLFYG